MASPTPFSTPVYRNISKGAKEKVKRETVKQRLSHLEEITREPSSSQKRNIGETLRDVVFMLTGKKPECLKHSETPHASPLHPIDGRNIMELKKKREQNRRDRHNEMFQILKDFVFSNGLFVENRYEKLERLTVINLVIDYVKNMKSSARMAENNIDALFGGASSNISAISIPGTLSPFFTGQADTLARMLQTAPFIFNPFPGPLISPVQWETLQQLWKLTLGNVPLASTATEDPEQSRRKAEEITHSAEEKHGYINVG